MPETVLVIGEALIDLVKHPGDEAAIAHPGGSPMNVALTLARLGRSTELITWIAKDDHGQQIIAHLQESGVAVSDSSSDAGQTSTALALLDETGAASYEFALDWNPPALTSIPSDTVFVHTGSIAAVLSPGADMVFDALSGARETALISYDPNARPSIMPAADASRALVERFISRANLVKASDEDVAWLYPGSSFDEVVAHWFDLGSAGLIVITAGKDGAAAWTRDGVAVKQAPEPVEVVDTVGAGDSFMGALINSLWARGFTGRPGAEKLGAISEAEVRAILKEANAVANVTVSRAGANPPWRHEL